MPQHSYKQLEEAYQRGVNKEHKPNPARTHHMSSRQGKGCPKMPITQTEPAQYSQDSQSDSDPKFDITMVNPNAESTRLDGAHPQDNHAPHHTKLKADNMDQHGHQEAPSDLQGPYTGYSHSPASQEDEIRHLRSELDQAQRDARSMSNDIRELVAGIQDLSSMLI